MYNTYGVALLTTCITQGRLTPTLGYKKHNAFSVELQWHCNLRQIGVQSTSFYAVKHVKLHDNLAYFIAWVLAVRKSNFAILYHNLMGIYVEKHKTNRIIPVR